MGKREKGEHTKEKGMWRVPEGTAGQSLGGGSRRPERSRIGVGALLPRRKVAQHGCSKSTELGSTRGQGGFREIQSGSSRKGAYEKATPLLS